MILGTTIGFVKGDTRSLDYIAYMGPLVLNLGLWDLGSCHTGAQIITGLMVLDSVHKCSTGYLTRPPNDSGSSLPPYSFVGGLGFRV